MMHSDPALTFLQEADDLLVAIETTALSIASQPNNLEAVNHIFRAFHTIKGSGAMFGFDQVAAFTHHVETMLDLVREGKVAVNEQLCTVVLAAADHIKLLLAAAQGGPPVNLGMQSLLLETLSQISQPETPIEALEVPKSMEVEDLITSWRIEFASEPEFFARGGNPFLLFRDLEKLGVCVFTAHLNDLPSIPLLKPDICYLRWTVDLTGLCTRAAIEDVFLFADGGQLLITPLDNAPPASVTVPEKAEGTLAGSIPQTADNVVQTAPASTREASVRVPAERLDRLVGLIGELVMNQSRLNRASAMFQSPELTAPVEEIDRLISELRDDVLQIRMMPIGSIFGRFRRLVRDLSLELGKEIELLTEGEDTELDKSILDQLGDPLIHLLRNSIDHGIEAPAVRKQAGKPTRGKIRLKAAHRSSDVVVTIEDDGAGLNRDRIRAKAVAKQLIPADASLSDKEIFNLILLPGFSTAQSVTSISGRGVGMDVVKRQIDVLRGSLNIASEAGQGTRVSLTLPLTLAIIDGLLIEAGVNQYILPMAAVTENVELKASDRILNNGRNIIPVRGELIPYIDLRQLFKMPGAPPPISKVVLVQYEDQRVGIVVDRVLGTHQTVIQALGRLLRDINVVSGSTIVGDGRVVLILDIASIVRLAGGEGQLAA